MGDYNNNCPVDMLADLERSLNAGRERIQVLADKLGAMRSEFRVELLSILRSYLPLLRDEPEKQRFMVAYLYWNVEEFSLQTYSELFDVHDAHIAAQKYQLHGLSCSKCGELLYIETRAELKKAGENALCKRCDPDKGKTTRAKKQEVDRRRAQLHAMPYYLYLKTPEWQAVRFRKLTRAQFACEMCFSRHRVQVHHKTYERRGYENNSDLIVLCDECHAKFHDKLPKE